MKGIRGVGKTVLIMVTFFLFSSWNALAQDIDNTVETVWSATMTVGSFTARDGTVYLGYESGIFLGDLTDNNFSYEGVNYRVKGIVKLGDKMRLDFLNNEVGFKTAWNSYNKTFYLNIGDSVQLDFRDRTIPSADEDEDYGLHEDEVRREWIGQSSYDWADGQEIIVSITTKYLDGALKLPLDLSLQSGTVTAGTIGRLKIFDDTDGDGTGRWKRICDDNWGDADAVVACSQLGLSGGSARTGNQSSHLSISTAETFLLDQVECVGTEDRVIDCPHDGRGVHDCAAWEIAGVTCTSP